MRSWTLHPEILYHEKDCKTYVSNWSETLQGLGAIQGKHKMHINHPQLNRFRQQGVYCESAMYTFLAYVYEDSHKRKTPLGNKFKFDEKKIDVLEIDYTMRLPVSQKQVLRELAHLNAKRASKGLPIVTEVKLHPMFYIDNNYVDCIEKGDRI